MRIYAGKIFQQNWIIVSNWDQFDFFFSFFFPLYTLIDQKKKKLTKYIDWCSFFNSTNRSFRCIAVHFQLLEYNNKIDSCKVNGYTRIAICNNNRKLDIFSVWHFLGASYEISFALLKKLFCWDPINLNKININ